MTTILFYLIALQAIYYTVKTAVLKALKEIDIEITYGQKQDKTADELD